MGKSSKRPNILFIMSDDHASHAISAYGSRLVQTPNIDRLAREGMRMDNCFCTNAICTPARATLLTGQYSHRNGVRVNKDALDGRNPDLLQKLLQRAGYQTAVVGKWHLGHGGNADPSGFDYWNVLPDQGAYFDPEFIEIDSGGKRKKREGYVTDLTVDICLDWLERRDRSWPFFAMCQFKAPHRPFEPAPRHAGLFEGEEIPEAATLWDDYSTRAQATREVHMRIDRHLNRRDLKSEPPADLADDERMRWCYQRFIKDYLRCVVGIDENVGRLLDWLDREGIADDTIVIYTADHGFFLGDHGWYDKRFMYEPALRIPFLIRYPAAIAANSSSDELMANVDFAPTLLDYAGTGIPSCMQGHSARPVFSGDVPKDWQQSIYYRYWMHGIGHRVASHYGIRTRRYKLIYYDAQPYGDDPTDLVLEPEWELFDLENDPHELCNVYRDPKYDDIVAGLTSELNRLQQQLGDHGLH